MIDGKNLSTGASLWRRYPGMARLPYLIYFSSGSTSLGRTGCMRSKDVRASSSDNGKFHKKYVLVHAYEHQAKTASLSIKPVVMRKSTRNAALVQPSFHLAKVRAHGPSGSGCTQPPDRRRAALRPGRQDRVMYIRFAVESKMCSQHPEQLRSHHRKPPKPRQKSAHQQTLVDL